MPTQTFHQLPDAKRKKFLKEAYKEFAIHSFDAASVTNLVKSLGIAKGSVYQYFNNKEELYNFLVNDADRQLEKASAPAPVGSTYPVRLPRSSQDLWGVDDTLASPPTKGHEPEYRHLGRVVPGAGKDT